MTTLSTFHRWLRDDDGQDLLEYALLVALISLAAVGAISTVGQTINDVFWDAISATMGGL